jgi:Heterokaryon incompatibility protein (HET)
MSAGKAKSRAFDYQSLKRDNVRFLQLNPAKDPQDPLYASLIQAPLVDAEFEALSYCWGEPKLTKTLQTSNGNIQITESLDGALRQFRNPDKTRLLWVDAICINQQSNVEKSIQITLMGDIFRSAKTVLVWLGPLSLHSLWSMEYLEVLASESERFGIPGPAGTDRVWIGDPQLTGGEEDGVTILESAMLAHVEALYERAWFTRLWIVQEAALAKNLSLCCGPYLMDWVDFELATTVLIAAFDAVGGYPDVMRPVLRAWKIITARNDYQMSLLDRDVEVDSYQTLGIYTPDMKAQDCTDDRDRVYALLSISRAERKIQPDYTKTVAQVYTDFATRHGGSNMLFNAGLCRRHPLSPTERLRVDPETQKIFANKTYLPSWVPDLRRRNDWRPIFNDVYNTSSGFRGRAFTSPDCPQMYFIHGLRFDTVESWVGLVGEDFRPTENVTSFFYMASVLAGFLDSLKVAHEKYPCGGSWRQKWPLAIATSTPRDHSHPLETLLEGAVTDWGLEVLWESYEAMAIDPDGEVYRAVDSLDTETIPSTFASSLSPAAQTVWNYHLYLSVVLARHMLIKTSRGFVGLAPPGVERGDVLVIFGGPSTPFVCRDVFPDGSVMVLVGPCFLQGVMEGEIYGDLGKLFDWIGKGIESTDREKGRGENGDGKANELEFPLMKGIIGLV